MATTFHFSKETPPDSTFTDIQTLNKFQTNQFNELVEYSLEFLSDPGKASRLMTKLEDFAEENGVNSNALKGVFKSLISIPNGALKKSLNVSQLKEDLVNLGLSVEKADYFCQQWNNNLASLSKGALGQTLTVNQLVDMEWKFGVTAASSEVDKVGNTFLQVIDCTDNEGVYIVMDKVRDVDFNKCQQYFNCSVVLKLVINTGNGIKNTYMELTLPQFYSFLHEMEKAKASLEYLS